MSLTVNDFILNGEYGSAGAVLERLGENHFKMTLGTAPEHPTWSNKPQFVLKNAKFNSLKLDLEIPIKDGGKYPITEYSYSWSYDNENWNPIHLENNNNRINTLHFPTFTKNKVYFGHQVPFSYEKMVELITKWGNSSYFKKKKLGQSINDRDLYRLKITDFENSNKQNNKKKWSHYFINIHPGEHNSQWRMVGMINWLLSDAAKSFRKNNICHFVLIASIDGPANGWYRVNQEGIDMNRSYCPEGSDQEKQAHEAYLCQKDLETLMNSKNPITTLWNMHTWQGPVEPIIYPGPEFETEVPNWIKLKEILEKNDPEGFVKKLQNGKLITPANPDGMREGWNGGPKRQFGITTVLCEGGSDLYSKVENLKSGENIIKSIYEFYNIKGDANH